MSKSKSTARVREALVEAQVYACVGFSVEEVEGDAIDIIAVGIKKHNAKALKAEEKKRGKVQNHG